MTTPTDDDPVAAALAGEALDADPARPADARPADVLASFAVLARFRRPAGSAEEAEATVRRELEPARGLFDDTRVEPPDPDGRWPVDVRFVVASVDNEAAVNGVHETLRGYGLVPDEAWVDARLT